MRPFVDLKSPSPTRSSDDDDGDVLAKNIEAATSPAFPAAYRTFHDYSQESFLPARDLFNINTSSRPCRRKAGRNGTDTT